MFKWYYKSNERLKFLGVPESFKETNFFFDLVFVEAEKATIF